MSKSPKHLIQRNFTWYARLGIPIDVRPKLGRKREFIQSLKTKDQSVAIIKAKPLIAEWQNAIHIARGNPSAIETTAIRLRNDTESHSRINPETGMSDADYYAEEIGEALDVGFEQETFYDYYTGRKGTPFNFFVEEFLTYSYENATTARDAKRNIELFTAHCPTVEDANHLSVMRWVQNETRSKATVGKCKNYLNKYWRYLQRISVVSNDTNPFTNVELPKSLRKKEDREPFTDDEIQFVHTKIKENDQPELEAAFLIAIYTGARISEIVSLTTDDIKDIDHISCFVIRESKTKAGIRTIPIHDNLKKLISKLCAVSNDNYLISNIKTTSGKKGKTDFLTKRFMRIIRNQCHLPATKVFHSLRNTVSTKLEAAGVPENIAADIVGHNKRTMTYGLYSGGTSTQQKYDAIKKISYDK